MTISFRFRLCGYSVHLFDGVIDNAVSVLVTRITIAAMIIPHNRRAAFIVW